MSRKQYFLPLRVFSFLLLLSLPLGAEVQLVLTPESTVAWSPTLSAADISKAGADFPSVVQSDPSLVDIDVTMLDINAWTVTIERTADISWDPDLVLSAAVTSVGTPGTAGATCTAKNGLNTFSPIITGAKTFVTGSRIRNDVKIQYQFTGHSASKIYAGIYSTTIIYTLTN